jgi:GAF domain-containing protein
MTYTQPDTRGGHLDELAALRRVATRVAARADLAELYALVAEEAALLIGAEGGSVMRLDDARTGAAVLVGGAMRHGNGRVGRSLRIAGRCAAAKALEEQVSNRTEYPERTGTCCPTGFACHTAVAAPVHVGGRLWGVLMAASEGVAGRPAPGAEVILEEFAQLVAFAVDNAELHA